jgi:CRP-like cAMP-binding protein
MQINTAATAATLQSFSPAGVLSRSGETSTAEDDLQAIGTVMSLSRGRELFAEGDAADSLYRVTAGVLRTCRLLPDGRRQVESFLMPGDFIGFEARTVHMMSAEAITTVTLVRYSRTRIERLAETSCRLSRRLLDIAVRQLADAHNRLLLLGRKTAEEKLASFMLEMLDRTNADSTLELSMSRADIADYLGLTIETVSRTFSSFRQQGVLALPSATRVLILDRDALEELTGDD